MLLCLVTTLIVVGAQQSSLADLTLDQQLIVACYSVDVDTVVTCLRKGANVKSKFGRVSGDAYLFRDRWTGGLDPVGSPSWTPLLALASSRPYPDPPAELGEIWMDRKRALALRKDIPAEQIRKRRDDAMTVLQILLSHGCAIHDDDGYGATPLYNAVNLGKLAFTKVLLERGANPNTKTRVYIDGPGDTTPLHVACKSQELTQLLLDHGADATARDSDGGTAADWVNYDSNREFDLVKTADGWRTRARNAK